MDPISNYRRALHDIGVLNWEDDDRSGENFFLQTYFSDFAHPVVLDIGAHHGEYARKIIKICRSAVVYAFEPHPETYKELEQCGQEHGFLTYNYGLGNRNESTTIYDYRHLDGSEHASIYRGVIEELHTQEAIAHPVRMKKLDDILGSFGLTRVNLLKIDTEGNEFEILLGAEHSIRRGMIDVIHFEFNEMNVISRTFFKDFYDFLPEYDFFRLIPNGAMHIPTYIPWLCEIFAYQNIVCTKKRM
jgi:FkbM family methyltransferase